MSELKQDTLIAQHEYVRHYINQADSKSAIGLVSSSALLVWVIKNYFPVLLADNVCWPTKILLIFAFLGVASTVVSFVLALWPRLTGSNGGGVFFYVDVASHASLNDFHSAYKESSCEGVSKEILNSIYFSSKICTKKFKLIQRGIAFGLASALLVGISFLYI
ncbi:Pycsar system effector family protein [Phaeobacter sp. HF9A]|uniref:Pycsar system effector family protein n=1 Tax=Phaeobacter sp. HF9A TaxID=2721561 RepID=UPI0014311EB5|nr:Pycsar system effector family protein [Phaeobacter sp. HF9A]NIZ13325.1 hypothetical protein [Phaeobacter sp. HF9A]